MERLSGIRVLVVTAAVLCLWAAALPAASLPRDRVNDAVREMESFFPPVSGLVVSVLNGTVFTDVPASAGLRPGSELTVFREGDRIVHPVTGQQLGRYETLLGVLRVVDIRGDYTTGEVVQNPSGEEMRAGDLVRVTATRLRVGLVENNLAEAGQAGGEEWMNEVFFALEDSERFQPVETAGIVAGDLSDAGRVRELCLEQGFQALLLVETGGAGGFLVMRLYSGATGLQVTGSRLPVMERTPRSSEPAQGRKAMAAFEEARSEAPTKSAWEITRLDYPVAGLCLGNLTEAGGELAVSDGSGVVVYRHAGATWEPFWDDAGESLYRVVSLDCADVDGNGRDELFVTRIAIGQLKSVVLEYAGGRFVEKDGPRNLFYRTVRSGGESRLFAQEFRSRDVGTASAGRYVWDGSGYGPVEGERMASGVHGFGLADIDGDGKQEILTLGEDDRLTIRRSSGDELWHSREAFGGSSLFLDAERLGQDLPRKETGGYVVKGRIAGADLDGDGAEELVLVRNVPAMGGFLKNVRRFDQALLGIYRWTGDTLVLVGDPEEIDGYVADYWLREDPTGAVELTVGVNDKSGSFKRGSGRIMTRLLAFGN